MRPDGRWVFKDENGGTWDAGQCHACRLQRKKDHGRIKYGSVSRDEVTDHCNKVGRQSERTAKEYFERRGYSVALVDVKGPDLTICKDGVTQTVEVKTATKYAKRAFIVAPVSDFRKGDDLIAYVDGKRVVVRPMLEHLSACGRDGSAIVTRFFKNPKDSQNSRVSMTTGFKGVCRRPSKKRTKPFYAYYFR